MNRPQTSWSSTGIGMPRLLRCYHVLTYVSAEEDVLVPVASSRRVDALPARQVNPQASWILLL